MTSSGRPCRPAPGRSWTPPSATGSEPDWGPADAPAAAYKLDTIVRMYSMTKAVTGVAAMILYEEGKFALSDPASKYLPELANTRVVHDSTDATGKPPTPRTVSTCAMPAPAPE